MEERDKPEFIVIEDKGQYDETPFIEEDAYSRSFKTIKKNNDFPWFTHILFFLASCVLASLIIGLGFFIALVGIMDLFSLFQVESIHQRFIQTFRLWKKLFAFLLGTTVGIISPQFGIAILTAYILLQGDNVQEQYIIRMFNRS